MFALSLIRKKIPLIVFYFFNLFAACNDLKLSGVNEVLARAGKNKAELLKVIQHYENVDKNTLKLKAAYFLIENIDGMQTLDTTELEVNEKYFDFISKIDRTGLVFPTLTRGVDSINTILGGQIPAQIQPKFINELYSATSDFLINNIDKAFYVWQNMPWAKHVSFDDFCEYILPYRCTETYASNIRDFFLDRYSVLPDSIRFSSNMTQVGRFIINDLQPWFKEDPNIFQRYPFLAPMKFSNILKARVGECKDANSMRVAALRAMGITVAFDEIPNWGNSNLPHYWYKIIDPKHDKIKSKITNENVARPTQHIISASYYDDQFIDGTPPNIQIIRNRSVPKVYRQCFSKQKSSLAWISDSIEIPPYFRNVRLKDVTNEYLETVTVELPLEVKIKDQKFAYLCVFDNQEWIPVAWSKIQSQNVEFTQVGKNIIYLLAYYKGGTIIPAGTPFLLDLNGDVQRISPQKQTETVKLFTKFPVRPYVIKWEGYMVGSRFQLANRSDLSDSTNIYTVKSLPFYQTEFRVENPGKYRFLIYQFKGLNYLELSELEFYGLNSKKEEVKLHGKFVGNRGYYPFSWTKLFDSIPYNFYRADTSLVCRYVGIDLGKGNETTITKIKFMPFTDDNAVRSGDTYELFYWDNEWKSLGLSVAEETNNVVFKNSPRDALLLLKNTNGGTQQRIFIYRNQKQMFW